MASLQEYDLDIKPSQVIHGLGLCKVATKSAHLLGDQNDIPVDDVLLQKEICFIPYLTSSWYTDIRTYIETGSAPDHLDPRKKRAVRLKSAPYQLINNVLFRKNADGVLLRCLEKEESDLVLTQLHDGSAGGHFGGDTTAHKKFRASYFWPTLFKYAHAFVRRCQDCQTVADRVKKPTFPLQPVMVDKPFQQWGIDIVGPINPSSSLKHKYIITATDYFTQCSEAKPLRVVNTNQVLHFLEANIITRFGVPETLVFDNASYFSSR